MTGNTPAPPKLSRSRFGSTVPSQADLALLSQPLTLPFSGKVIKNRFCKAALSESLAGAQGQFDKDHLDRFVPVYDAWAAGGSGLVLTGNVMVDRTMREMEHNVSVEDSRDLGRLKVWAQTVQKHGRLEEYFVAEMHVCRCISVPGWEETSVLTSLYLHL